MNDDLSYDRLGNESNTFPVSQLINYESKRLSVRGYNSCANGDNNNYPVHDNIDINNVEFTIVVRGGKLYMSVAGHNTVFDISAASGHTYFGFSASGVNFKLTNLSLKTAGADIDGVITRVFG